MTALTSRSASSDSFTIVTKQSDTMASTTTKPKHGSPYLRRTKNSSQLIVKGKPFLMLAGELHNSSLSSGKYMSTVYPTMKSMNLNTLLGSVTWEMIEPIEGKFDFAELDACIVGARQHQIHLVLLWFGSFKNAMSTYVPGWVKQDVSRFPRAHVKDKTGGLKTIELISPFSDEAMSADSRAFAKLMAHLKDFDGEENTVLMIQVENEIGLLGDSLDRSKIAERKFREPVPKDTMAYLENQEALHPIFEKRWPGFQERLKTCENKDWEDVFGSGIAAEEMFMADTFARYVSRVAAAGKKEYNIPFYANCWLNFDDPSVLDLSGLPHLGERTSTAVGGGAKAGVYPSGGPVPYALDIWNCHTVDKEVLDFISPDLYLHDYEWVNQQYRYRNNPLFIPEQKADAGGTRRTWLAYGTYGCIGCSPFGIDTVNMDQQEMEGWQKTYGLLSKMSSHILEAQAERPDEMFGFFFDEVDYPKPGKEQWKRSFPGIQMEVIVERSFVFGKPSPGYGIVLHQGDGRFLLVGAGFRTTFRSTNPKSTFTGILSATEKEIDNEGKLSTLRTMNGDETRGGMYMLMPTESPDYGGFPIRVTIPARTYIAEAVAYSLEETEEHF